MKRLLKRLSRSVAATDDTSSSDSSSSSSSSSISKRKAAAGAGAGGGGGDVPAGHVPVCVGEEGGPVERFAVRAELLGEPAFAALLRRAAQEYGYAHPGALRIPCPVADFRRLLLRLSHSPNNPCY